MAIDVNSEIKRLKQEEKQRDVPGLSCCDLPCVPVSGRGWGILLLGAGVLWLMSSLGILSAGALWPLLLIGCGLFTLAATGR